MPLPAPTVRAGTPCWPRCEHRPISSLGGFMHSRAGFIDAFLTGSSTPIPPCCRRSPAHAVPDALAHGVKVTGTTVHIVDAGVDTGPILAQEAVVVEDGDTVDTLHERIKIVERRLLVDVLHTISERGITRDGRKAKFS